MCVAESLPVAQVVNLAIDPCAALFFLDVMVPGAIFLVIHGSACVF